MTYEPPVESGRGRAWTIAVPSAFLAFVLLVMVHVSSDRAESASFQAGQVLPLAVMGGGAGLALALSRPNLQSWIVTATVVGTAVLLYLLLHALPRSIADADRPETAEPTRVLQAPDEAAGWQRLDDSGVLERAAASVARTDASGLARDAVYGEYERGGRQELLTFAGFTPTDSMLDDVQADALGSLRDLLARAGASDVAEVDAGELGGAMACSTDAVGAAGLMVCGWADDSTMAHLSFDVPDLDLDPDRAAALTRDFREDVTRDR